MKGQIYHILNGDSLAYSFLQTEIVGTIVVFREGLIEGNLTGENLPEFWQTRAAFTGVTEIEYYNKVVKELNKLMDAPDNSEFNLWFEYDLFCKVNMWFVCSILQRLPITKKVYAAYTSYLNRNNEHFWNGFGRATASDLHLCFQNRILLQEEDIKKAQELWTSYKNSNTEKLIRLSRSSSAFPYLQEVIAAHIERFPNNGMHGRPEKTLRHIIDTITTDFHTVCNEFWSRDSIYGFGDTQIKHLYDKIIQER